MSKKMKNPEREKLLCQLQSIILGGVGLFLFISLATYNKEDLTHLANPTLILNWGGKLGAFISENLRRFTGTISYFYPIGFITFAWFYGKKIDAVIALKKSLLLVLPFIASLLLLHNSGFLGHFLATTVSRIIGDFGKFILAMLLIIIFTLEKLKKIINEPRKKRIPKEKENNKETLLHGDRIFFNKSHQDFSTPNNDHEELLHGDRIIFDNEHNDFPKTDSNGSQNLPATNQTEQNNLSVLNSNNSQELHSTNNNAHQNLFKTNNIKSSYKVEPSTREKLLQDFKNKARTSNEKIPLITKIIFDDKVNTLEQNNFFDNSNNIDQQPVETEAFLNDANYLDNTLTNNIQDNSINITTDNSNYEENNDDSLGTIGNPLIPPSYSKEDINKPLNNNFSYEPDREVGIKQPVNNNLKSKPQFNDDYQKPGFHLLATRLAGDQTEIKKTILENAAALERTFREFGIEVKVTDYKQGPVITRYELSIPPGIKIQKIVSLQDNIALNLAAASVRIEAPIPGKSAIGIEIPNKTRTLVSIREILESEEFKKTEANIPIVLGRTVSGKSKITDLSAMPHLIIAGTTGSGKSVCVNTIICSIVYKMPPQKIRFILIDPKYVELAPYNDIPHLLTPVINKPHTAITVLKWLVKEMEQRYLKLQQLNSRNIIGYNEKVVSGNLPPAAVANEYTYEEMPYLVVIIDELADLMILAAKEIENSISRLAAMSRAVGIHLIFATQRPSVDVITGVIKNNFPSRIAFQVASSTDSRTILDKKGADKLLGKGDSLFIGPGTPYPERIQGAFLSDEEVDKTTDYLKSLGAPQYNHSILEDEGDTTNEGSNDDEKDILFDEAIEIVLQSNRASASYLQRKLKIGYNRAARIIEHMEDEKIIGPQQGSKPREILIN